MKLISLISQSLASISPLRFLQRVEVRAFITDSSGRILLVRRSRSEAFLPHLYELPGGKTRFLEKPMNALKREIYEEVGLQITSASKLVYVTDFPRFSQCALKHYVSLVYPVLEVAGQVRLADEHDDYAFLSPVEIVSFSIRTTPVTTEILEQLSHGEVFARVITTNTTPPEEDQLLLFAEMSLMK